MDCSLLIFNCLTLTSFYIWCAKIKQYNTLLCLFEAEKWDVLDFFHSYILGCYLIRMVDVSNIEKLGFKYGWFHDCGPNTSWLQISFFYMISFCILLLRIKLRSKQTYLPNQQMNLCPVWSGIHRQCVWKFVLCYIIT